MEPNNLQKQVRTKITYKQTYRGYKLCTILVTFIIFFLCSVTIASAYAINEVDKNEKQEERIPSDNDQLDQLEDERISDYMFPVEIIFSDYMDFFTFEPFMVESTPISIHQEESMGLTEIVDNVDKIVKESVEKRIKEKYEKKLEDVQKSKTKTGWTKVNLNLRKTPDLNSEVLSVYPSNAKVQYTKFNNTWAAIKKDDTIIGFMALEYIGKEPMNYRDYPTIQEYQKSYMPYTAITSRSSKQYKLQTMATTGNYGIRMVNGRYLVALGSFYTTDIGRYFDLILKNGTIIPCILGDAKANIHTDKTNRYTLHDGSVAEFIIDNHALPRNVRRMGNVGYANDSWNSPIVKIRIYDTCIF